MSALVLVVDANPGTGGALQNALGGDYRVVHVPSVAAAFEAYQAHQPDVLVVGARIEDSEAAHFLKTLRMGVMEDVGHRVLFLGDHSQLPPVDADDGGDVHVEAPVFFAIPPTLSADRVRLLVNAIAAPEGLREERGHTAIEDLGDPREVQAILEASRRMAMMKDPASAAQVAATAAMDFTEADRGHFYYYDHDTGMLFSGNEDDPRESVASTTLSGFSVRTNLPFLVERADADPLWTPDFDDPDGGGDAHLAFQPIADSTGEVHAVIVVAREGRRPPFAPVDVRGLAALAESFGPSMQLLSLQVVADNQVDAEEREKQAGDLFTEEAQEAYRSVGRQGDVVRITPQWMVWAYRTLLALLLAGAVFVNIAKINEYAVGPAVVFLTGRVEVTTRVAGTVGNVVVESGQRVRGGAILIELYSAEERADLDRLRNQYEADVVSLLTNPGDENARRSVAASAAARNQAARRLEEKTIRAPFDGHVGDLRVRVGQPLAPGQQVLSMLRDDSEVSVVAFIPGSVRPNLKKGQIVRLHLRGYEDARPELRVEKVGEEIVGPEEASRFLPMRLADSVRFPGPVVLVTGRLASRMFTHRGVTYYLHDGMQARAEVAVRSRTIMRALAPSISEIGTDAADE